MVGLAEGFRVELPADALDRPHEDAIGHFRLVADEMAQAGVQRIGQRLGERGEQHARAGIAPR